MFFIGVDLAWSSRNPTGVSILEISKGKLYFKTAEILDTNQSIVDFILKHTNQEDSIISIDAPLIVPNQEGRRYAEHLVSTLFRKYHAGAHPSNRKRLSQWTGDIRGETLSKLLEEQGFKHSPYIEKKEKTKKFFEVFPHPSMVVLFNLDKIIKYKAKPKRDYEFRWREFKTYQKHLKSLKIKFPKEVIDKEVTKLKGKALKNYEDILDSIFCAYLSFYAWKYPKKCSVLGCMKEGYILTPLFKNMKKQLNKLQKNRT